MDLDLRAPQTDATLLKFLRALTGDGLIKGISTVELTIDPPSLATTADGTATATVPVSALSDGAQVGDGVILIPPYDMQEVMFSGAISAENTVEVTFYNANASTINLASGTWIAMILHRG
jgi:hypothetical protein